MGKARVVLAKSREVPTSPVAPEIMKTGMKRIIKMTLGSIHAPELNPLARDAAQMAMRVIKEMPSAGTSVCSSVAAQARHRMLATYYANKSLELGPDTEQGQKFAEAAAKHDMTAERIGVSAYDRAVHEARAQLVAKQQAEQSSLATIVTSSEPVDD
jgi:hypothetical protein